MEITKCLTISSAHVTAETMSKLGMEPEANMFCLSVYPKADYGYWVYVGKSFEDCSEHVPDDLKACIRLAEQNYCEWLCLDCDAETVDELLVYDW